MSDQHKEVPVALPTAVDYEFVKSTLYRVIPVDGVWGGITPRAKIFMGLFNDHAPVPTRTRYQITPDGGLGAEMRDARQVSDALERELEVGAMLDLDIAIVLRTWLDGKIEELQRLNKALAESGKGDEPQ